jgi:hypothetical protein
MTRRVWWLRLELLVGWRETAGPSTTLRSGRDDKGSGVAQVGVVSGMGRNRRSLRSFGTPPDFLWRPVAPMNCMRFSLKENRTRGPCQQREARNPGPVGMSVAPFSRQRIERSLHCPVISSGGELGRSDKSSVPPQEALRCGGIDSIVGIRYSRSPI